MGSVLRVKPEGLRLDQPLTDLGLDSLMAVEIETLIENTIGVALPPASLMRARTIGQIAVLIAEHLGISQGESDLPSTLAMPANAVKADEVNLDALSDEDVESLVDDYETAESSREVGVGSQP